MKITDLTFEDQQFTTHSTKNHISNRKYKCIF